MAAIGQGVRGRTDKAQLVGSWSQFERLYGGFPVLPDAHLYGPLAVFLHFQNGGGPLWYSRIVGAGGGAAKKEDLQDHSDGANSIDVYAQNAGKWGNSVSISSERYEVQNEAVQAIREGTANATDPGVFDVKNLLGIQVGDIIDCVAEDGLAAGYAVVGGLLADGVNHVTTRGLAADTTYALIADDAQLNASAGIDAVGFKIRSCSTHTGRSRLSEQMASAATTLKVASSAGFEIGSFVTAVLVALCEDDNTRDKKIEGHGIVSSISGQSLTLSGQLVKAGGANLSTLVPVDAKAYALQKGFDTIAADGLSFVAVPAGSDGNTISVEFKAGITQADLTAAVPGAVYGGAGAEAYIHVVGNAIVVYTQDSAAVGGDANLVTLSELVTLINADLAAKKLVTAALLDAGDAGSNVLNTDDKAAKFLTGGAYAQVVTQEFDLLVREGGKVKETHPSLSIVAASKDYIGNRLGGTSAPTVSDDNESNLIICLRDAVLNPGGDVLSDASIAIEKFPRSMKDTQLAGGTNGATPSDVEALGVATQGSETGIYTLEGKAGIECIAIPGFSSPAIAKAGADFAERNETWFAMDTSQADNSFNAIVNFVNGELVLSSSFAGLYAPWVKMPDPRSTKKRIEVPPTCFALPTWSVTRSGGAHASPANVRLAGPDEPSIRLTETQRAELNAIGVNVLRHISGRGYRIMGARTLHSGNDSRKFLSVRRWLNHLRRNARILLADLVFAPNTEGTMRAVRKVLSEFLGNEHSGGALYPTESAALAYRVKADAETTTAADQAAGDLNVEVSVSPATPAERINVAIGSETGGITITESVE